MSKQRRARVLAEINAAMGLPHISVEFDRRLTAAAKAGEQDAIRKARKALNPEQRRALAILAGSFDGVNEAMLEQQYGFTAALLDGLVAIGLLRSETRRHGVRGSTRPEIKVRRFFITPAGQEAIKQ